MLKLICSHQYIKMKKSKRFEEINYIIEKNEIEDNMISNQKITSIVITKDQSHYSFDNCIIENCKFVGEIDNLSLYNVQLLNCDFTGCTLSNLVMTKTIIKECRLTGTNIYDSRISFSDFINNQMMYININTSKTIGLILKNNNISNGILDSIEFAEAELIDNDLSYSEILHTSMANVDITSNKIDGISISPECVRNMIVDEIQAITLVGILGIKIK